MRVLITGGAGLLGSALLRAAPAGVELHATQRRAPVDGATAHALDLAHARAVRETWGRIRPQAVIHTAYSTEASERDVVGATQNVAEACAEHGAGLVHVSTDMVFDGEAAPYLEDAPPAPVTPYGRHKADAERIVREALPGAAIVRTSLILRADPPDRTTGWVADALRAGEPVRLFTDELRSPIAVDDLAAQLWELAALPADERAGPWHLVGPESLSRYALGLLIAARFGLDPSGITPAPSSESPSPRPRDLRLLAPRADRALRTRPRPASSVLAKP